MAKALITLPQGAVRCILRLASACMALVFMVFSYATGQTGQRQVSVQQAESKGMLGKTLQLEAPLMQPLYGVVVEYGAPTADFSIKGMLRDQETSQALEEIQVCLYDTTQKKDLDTVATDADGKFAFSLTSTYPWYNTWIVRAEDIDGQANGNYKDKDTLVTIPQDDLAGGSGWYSGSGEVDIELLLEKKATHTPGQNVRSHLPPVTLTQEPGDHMTVTWSLPKSGKVRLAVYTAEGRFIRELSAGTQAAGTGSARFSTRSLAGGIYFLKLRTPGAALLTRLQIR